MTQTPKRRGGTRRTPKRVERGRHRGRRAALGTFALSLLAGLGLAAAFPPVNLWWLAPLSLAAFQVLAARTGPGTGLLSGLGLGLGLFTPLLHFTSVAMGNAVGWAALVVVETSYLGALGLIWALVRHSAWMQGSSLSRMMLRAGVFAVLWGSTEEIRSSWPWGGFPFGRLAYAMAEAPVLAVASLGGSLGLSLVVALISSLLAETATAIRRSEGIGALTAAVCAGFLLTAPLLIPLDTRAQDGTLRVAAVQGNVATDFEDAFNRALEVTGNHAQGTAELAESPQAHDLDLVIWPENAADLDPREHPEAAATVEEAAQAVGVPILLGAIDYEDNARYNDQLVWTPGQGAGTYYRKHRPVPFGEFIPLRQQLRRITTQVDRIAVDLKPGTGPVSLTVHAAAQDRDVRLAVGICFEVAYDQVLRQGVNEGGELIVIPTNNASFLRSSEADQQLAQGQVQAVVHGRSVVQVSTVGVTAVIGPNGVIEQQAEPYTRAFLVADVPLRTQVSVADRLGSAPARATLALGVFVVTAGIVSGIRTRLGSRRP